LTLFAKNLIVAPRALVDLVTDEKVVIVVVAVGINS
jgi:hypothetical protein